MATTSINNSDRSVGYDKLIGEFRLLPITSDAMLDAAIARLDGLLARTDLDESAAGYIDVLAKLIEDYEDRRFGWPAIANDGELLRCLLEFKDISQADLARDVDMPRSTISEILAGKRALNRDHIRRLADYFHVSPAVFFNETAERE